MAKYRERYNDKARAGSVQKRLELKARRQKSFRESLAATKESQTEGSGDNENSSTLILTPKEKEARKRQLHEIIKPESKISSKKRKRIDKYIDLKVRQQERDEIFAKLAASSVDTSQMQSLSRLGQTGDLKKSFASLDEEDSEEEEESDREEVEVKSTFIDNRRRPGGFGFQNITKVAAAPKKKAMTWKERLGAVSEDEGSDDDKSDEESDDSESSDSESDDSKSDSDDNDTGNVEEVSDDTGDSEDESEEADEEEISTGKVSEGKKFAEWAHSLEKHESLPTPKVEGYKHTPRPLEVDSLPDLSKGGVSRGSQYFVHVSRSAEVTESRLKLPALANEQQIMEAIHHHDVVVLTGATGSGKTTQVPQFLYEAGYGSPGSNIEGLIGITQPRRVAAVSMADRVGKELGDHGKHVGYQIRFDAKVNSETRVKFMTDGLLLRELSTDLRLEKYSVIIVDEAHERSVNTDILIGMLSRVVKLRREESNPLKLIIMSATLRVSDFTENSSLFTTPPPVVSLDARQYPVSIHFNRRTPHDYVEEAISKAKKIHDRLPKGGILIFLTGQNEIMHAVKELQKYGSKGTAQVNKEPPSVRLSSNDAVMEEENIELDFDEENIDSDHDDFDNDNEEGEEEGFEEEYDGEETKLKVLPLYSLLPTSEQLKVFKDVPKDTRLCVVATNVAETSLTIPGIRYVVDCGRAKQREYDEKTGVVKFRVSWVSKAAADQRAGRAGRTGPGHCYRIFSSAVYERDFELFSKPEIMRMPIESLVLQMKAMGIDRIINFPFPTPPSQSSLKEGLKLLEYLGAINQKGSESALTSLGKEMAQYPLHPRLSKMLMIGNQFDCLPFVVAIVAALAVGDPFMQAFEVGLAPSSAEDEDETVKEKEQKAALRYRYMSVLGKLSALDPRSDVFRCLAAVAGFGYADSASSYCKENFLREKVMQEIEKLRHQISHLVASTTRPDAVDTVTKSLSKKLPLPSKQQIAALKQIIGAGYVDKVAVRADYIDDVKISKRTNITQMPYSTLFASSEKHSFIHPDSVLAHLGSQPPEFLIYHSITQGDDEHSKLRLRALVDISAAGLSNIAANTPLITYSKPLGGAYAPKAISPVKREAWLVPRMGATIGSGGVGWDLPVKKVTQVKKHGEWCIE